MKKTFSTLALLGMFMAGNAQVFVPDGGGSPVCGGTYWWPCTYYQGFAANWHPNPAVAASYYIDVQHNGIVADVHGTQNSSPFHFEVGTYSPTPGDRDIFYYRKKGNYGIPTDFATIDVGPYVGLGSSSADGVYKITYDDASGLLYMCGVIQAAGSGVDQPFLLCFNTTSNTVQWAQLLPFTPASNGNSSLAFDVALYNSDAYVVVNTGGPLGAPLPVYLYRYDATGSLLATGTSAGSASGTFLSFGGLVIDPASNQIVTAGLWNVGSTYQGFIMSFDLSTLAFNTWATTPNGSTYTDVDVDLTTGEFVTIGNANGSIFWESWQPTLAGTTFSGTSSATDYSSDLIVNPQGDYILLSRNGGIDYLTYIDKVANDVHYGAGAYAFTPDMFVTALHKDEDGKVLVGGIDQAASSAGANGTVFTARFDASFPPWPQYQNKLALRPAAPTAEAAFMLAPNPATDGLTVTHATGRGTYEVWDVTGKKVLTQEESADGKGGTLSVGRLTPGLYQLRYTADGQPARTATFVKQ